MIRAALLFLIFMFLSTLFIPLLVPYDIHQLNLSQSLVGMSFHHPFGLDENGQDLFLKILYGARVSLLITFSVVTLSFFIGLFFGFLAGYFGGVLDYGISTLVDLVLAFPKFLLALALVAMWGSSFFHLVLALSFSTWATFARLVRGEVRHLKKKEFVLSAKAYGGGSFLLFRKHIWPSLFSLMAVHGMFQVSGVLIAESGLSFLGLGVALEIPSWGGLIHSGREFLLEAPHLIFFPSLFLCLLLVSLNILGDALRDHLNPQGKL